MHFRITLIPANGKLDCETWSMELLYHLDLVSEFEYQSVFEVTQS